MPSMTPLVSAWRRKWSKARSRLMRSRSRSSVMPLEDHVVGHHVGRRRPPGGKGSGPCRGSRRRPDRPSGGRRLGTSATGAAARRVGRALDLRHPGAQRRPVRRRADCSARGPSCTGSRHGRRSAPTRERMGMNLSIMPAMRGNISQISMPGTLVGIGVELAADFRRGLGLDVPHVEVGRAARQEDIDDRLVRTARACLSLGLQQSAAATARPAPCRRSSRSSAG